LKIRNLLLTLVLALMFSQPSYAKGLLLMNTGDELFELAAFPEQMISGYPGLKGVSAGYKCDRFGLFWADVWTWNCTLVAINGDDSYSDLPQAITSELASDPSYGFKHAKRGFWNHYGIAAVLGALGLMSLLRRIF
jgi:hypothetical protein